jgi:hypothetical protein
MSANSTQKIVRSAAKFLVILVNAKHAYMQERRGYAREAKGAFHESPLSIFHLAFSCSDGLHHAHELRS